MSDKKGYGELEQVHRISLCNVDLGGKHRKEGEMWSEWGCNPDTAISCLFDLREVS